MTQWRVALKLTIALYSIDTHSTHYPREDAGGLSREYVLRTPSVS